MICCFLHPYPQSVYHSHGIFMRINVECKWDSTAGIGVDYHPLILVDDCHHESWGFHHL
jgi:hypothetical protein